MAISREQALKLAEQALQVVNHKTQGGFIGLARGALDVAEVRAAVTAAGGVAAVVAALNVCDHAASHENIKCIKCGEEL